jgi:hypothetical protein
MPSLNDIPTKLLQTRDKTQFLTWLSALPLDPGVRNHLVKLYSEQTKIPITQTDWQIINRFPTPPRNQNASRVSPPTRR